MDKTEYKRMWIRDLLKERGIPLSRMAEVAGVRGGALHNYLSDDGDLGMRYAIALSRVTGLSLPEIARRCGHEVPDEPDQGQSPRVLGVGGRMPDRLRQAHGLAPIPAPTPAPAGLDLDPGQYRIESLADGRVSIRAHVAIPPEQASEAIATVVGWAAGTKHTAG